MYSQQRYLRQSAVIILFVATVLFFYSSYLFAKSSYNGCGGELVEPINRAYETKIAELVNIERAAQGLPPLKLDDALTNAARYHATDMSQDDYFNHQTHDRSEGVLTPICDWTERIAGYYTSSTALAENLATGDLSPESVMAGWMSNSEHRASILGNYREIGVGYSTQYWVQNLGVRAESFPIIINREAQQTASPVVQLYIYGEWQQMRLRNNDGSWSEWQEFHSETTWTLDNTPGEQWVEVELKNDTLTVTARDTILLTTTATPVATTPPNPTPTAEVNATVYLPTVQR